jgi:hypothetical protein
MTRLTGPFGGFIAATGTSILPGNIARSIDSHGAILYVSTVGASVWTRLCQVLTLQLTIVRP